jgi:hypothetical protein
LLN